MKTIRSSTIADLKKQLAKEKREERTRISQLERRLLKALEQRHVMLKKEIEEVESEIANYSGHSQKPRRSYNKRMSEDEKYSAIENFLARHPKGANGHAIAEALGVTYPTISGVLQNRRRFRQTGARKNRLYFLKK